VERTAAEHDHVYRVGTGAGHGGQLAAESYEIVKVTFTPAMTGTFSSESFKFITPGGNVATLNLRGTAIGPSVSLSTSAMQFGSVVSGGKVAKVLYIENASDVASHWQIDSECMGTFSLDHDRGVIAPRSTSHVTVTFTPIEAANYHRRLVVVLRDRAPLALDCVGTCYTDKRRPAPMLQSHVEAYRARCAAGLLAPGQPPSDAERAPFEEETAAQAAGALTSSSAFSSLFVPDPLLAVALDSQDVDFGACSRLRLSEYKVVTVTNNSAQKLTVFWGGQDQLQAGDTSAAAMAAAAAAAEKAPFAVFPESADLRPGQQQQFRVSFRPSKDNNYYSRQLECFAYVKSMRSFRLVTEENFTPPWTCTVWAHGHTFGGATEAFMPKCLFSSRGSRLMFPPTVRGDCSYQTLTLTNEGDTAVSFAFPAKRGGGGAASLFSCFPSKGVVAPKSFGLVTFRFDAADTKPHHEALVCALNGSTDNSITLDVHAQGHVPRLKVGADNSFVFKPTCVGAVTARDVELTNLSRINVLYEWAIPERLAATLGVSPHAGLLRGGETLKSSWTFCPQKVKRLGVKVPLIIRVQGEHCSERELEVAAGGGDEPERVNVTVIAEATSGAVTMKPESVAFGTSVVDDTQHQTVELYNQSSGMVRYRMECVFDEGSSEFDAEVRFDEPTGMINARACKPVKVAFTGLTRAAVGFKVVCHTVSDPGLGATAGGGSTGSMVGFFTAGMESPRSKSMAEGAEPPPSVAMTASADYPTLCVTDVACGGVAKPTLWRQLSVNQLNAQLSCPPSSVENRLQRTGGADGSLVSERALAPLSAVSTGLGVAVEGAEPTAVYLEVCNTGALPVDWKLLLRNEVEVEMENWVELGEPSTETDAHQRFIVEHGVMEVTPRTGTLEPGQRQPVRVLYRHDHVGDHSLTALLTVKHGRSVRLELEGRTVPLDAKCLSVGPAAAAVHTLTSVTIGDREPPLQTMELRNPCADDVRYEVDLGPVEALNALAWEFPVLTCKNPVGVVPAFGTAIVNWVFQPVEAKAYECAVDVHIEGGETSEMTLRGVGTLPAPAGGGAEVVEVVTEVDDEGEVVTVGDADRSAWLGYQPTPTLPPTGDFQLSTHACVLGTVPALSVNRRVVLLRSTAEVDYDFSWDLCAMGGAGMDGVLKVEPSKGVVPAGGTVFCKVVFTAGVKPQVFDAGIRCELAPVSPSAEEVAYEEAALEEEASREEVLALHGAPEPSVGEGGGMFAWTKSQRVSVVHAATMSSTARHPDVAAAGALEHQNSLPMPSPPPGNVTIAMGVEGRVAPEVAYREENGKEAFDRFFVPSFRPALVPEQLPAHLDTDDAANVIAALLHDTLSDPSVRRGFDSLEEEAIPYYAQMRAGRGGGVPSGGAAPAAAGKVVEATNIATTADAAASTAAVEGATAEEATSETVVVTEEDEAEAEAAAAEGDAEVSVSAAEVSKAEANPEFREIAEWALEATLYNLVKELHAQQLEQHQQWEEEY
jgi:P pilus assembly chaperone PapD